MSTLERVTITPELRDFIESEVDSGLYENASQVVCAGLRLLQMEPLPLFHVRTRAGLKAKLDECETRLAEVTGGVVDSRSMPEIMADIRERNRAAVKARAKAWENSPRNPKRNEAWRGYRKQAEQKAAQQGWTEREKRRRKKC